MRWVALATDYDGTLARDGRVDDRTVEALRRARAAGIRLIMVTGRELKDLLNIFPQTALFDRVVAENGAVLYDPASGAVRVLAPPPPPRLLERLAERAVPVFVGRSIVATVTPHDQIVRAAIRDLELDWHVIFNKESVMALPANVTKASGLAMALEALGVSPAQTVGIGDAENDQAFLGLCGHAAAVANALPEVKAAADVVTCAAYGAGVREVIDELLR